jgi:hypothetical protein
MKIKHEPRKENAKLLAFSTAMKLRAIGDGIGRALASHISFAQEVRSELIKGNNSQKKTRENNQVEGRRRARTKKTSSYHAARHDRKKRENTTQRRNLASSPTWPHPASRPPPPPAAATRRRSSPFSPPLVCLAFAALSPNLTSCSRSRCLQRGFAAMAPSRHADEGGLLQLSPMRRCRYPRGSAPRGRRPLVCPPRRHAGR